MAKALLGHVGVGPDLRLAAEVRRLRGRVVELEEELLRLRSLNEALTAVVRVDPDLDSGLDSGLDVVLEEERDREPALA